MGERAKELIEKIKNIVYENGLTGEEPGLRFISQELLRVFIMAYSRILTLSIKGEEKRGILYHLKMLKDGRVYGVLSYGDNCGTKFFLEELNERSLYDLLDAIETSGIKDYYSKRNAIYFKIDDIIRNFGEEDNRPQINLRENMFLNLKRPIKMRMELYGAEVKVVITNLYRYEDWENPRISHIIINEPTVKPEENKDNPDYATESLSRLKLKDLKKLLRNLEYYAKNNE